jgi:ankyrin repeat protein
MAGDDKIESWFSDLMKEVRVGNTERVAELLQAGHDVNRLSEEDRLSPLSVACQHGRLEVAKLLLEHGADVSIPGMFSVGRK